MFETIKQNRIYSFITISIIYILTSILGILTYYYFSQKYIFYINLLLTDIICTLFVFIFSLLFSNSSVYDPYWSVQPIIIALSYQYFISDSLNLIRILLHFSILFWGIRLTLNWAYTSHNLYTQDWRYVYLKEVTNIFYPFINLFGIHLFPTIIVYLCVLPSVYIIMFKCKEINLFFILSFLLSIIAIILESVSDYQMHMFRKNKNNKEKFIRNGLWKYSRHPNYLGEILFWWGIGFMAIFGLEEKNYYLLIGPLSCNLMFVLATIHLADNHQKRKKGFDKYYKETNMLLPFNI